ncbi:CDP-glycerol glycerophosphotransferase family protein [Actinomyces sp. MRS3W]|uniref:bifunctional glycosyltransferase/CDP-glycerol:glycerophosphate glycerophosphotransferase n=1 Tax=Actinomyces sp. MRS3W TaxID=2800796 RepID=UPI0028FD213A|nr:CDP-glycerol glycerophosphotransferase family protein [Actinomyces sp. MRS3W]MDU0347376.1 CDP-glycerol glycerophosphotransferase family protein [Actinomyces sp. MRS3W]
MKESAATVDLREISELVCETREETSHPRISVIVAVYDVEQYVSGTLRSFAAQKYLSQGDVEYIFVSDRSPDNSLEIIEYWARRRGDTVVIEASSNGGPAHARNIGLRAARGEWVTSVDPDDVISETYFAEVLRMIDAARDAELALVSTRVLITEDGTGRFSDTHPLGKKFRYGNRFVRLGKHPECIQLGATVFMRRDVLMSNNLFYDIRCVPTFEDGGLIGKYLARFDEPVVGLASTAHYFYRKRSTNDSAVQRAFSVPERYTNVLQYGYLAMLNDVRNSLGVIPAWASNMVLYDLAWYFKQDDSMKSVASWISGALRDEFLGLLRKILGMIPPQHIENFHLNPMAWSMRQALLLWSGSVKANARLIIWKNSESNTDFSVLTGPQVSDLRMLVNAKDVPEENIVGRHLYRFFGEAFMLETTVRMSGGDIAVFADGVPVRSSRVVRPGWPKQVMDEALASLTDAVHRDAATPSAKRRERLYVRALISGVSRHEVVADRASAVVRHSLPWNGGGKPPTGNSPESEARRLLADASFQTKWSGCWVLLDHIDRADDNAEHLMRFMLNERKEIRAVYLLTRDSRDWQRLENEGFPLVEYGSPEAWAITSLSSVVVSSDAVEGCMYPAPRSVFGAPKYKYVFLQHGISDKDISRWLNGKQIDLLTAATQAEYDAFTKKDSPYKLTTDEVALTGFARYDALEHHRAQNGATRPSQLGNQRTVLVMPTWRQYLKDTLEDDATDSEKTQQVFDSSFGSAWMTLMRSERLVRYAADNHIRLRFLLHPNLTALLQTLDLDPVVEIVPTVDMSFQRELRNASALLTDYSSLIFDAAYLGIPVAYFRFDEPELLAGGHSWRPGYFDYETMGLGPCLYDAPAVEDWVIGLASSSFTTPELYRHRIVDTFVYWDDRNCERIFDAISGLLKNG